MDGCSALTGTNFYANGNENASTNGTFSPTDVIMTDNDAGAGAAPLEQSSNGAVAMPKIDTLNGSTTPNNNGTGKKGMFFFMSPYDLYY
jgi:hypothetical protein